MLSTKGLICYFLEIDKVLWIINAAQALETEMKYKDLKNMCNMGPIKKKPRNLLTTKTVKTFFPTYFHQLGVSESGAHKHHAIIQVGQTLGNRGLS